MKKIDNVSVIKKIIRNTNKDISDIFLCDNKNYYIFTEKYLDSFSLKTDEEYFGTPMLKDNYMEWYPITNMKDFFAIKNNRVLIKENDSWYYMKEVPKVKKINIVKYLKYII